MHDQRVELVLEPGLGGRVVGLKLDRAILLDRHLAGERPAVEMAAELGRKAREIAPLGAVSDRLLEESGRLGVRVVPLQRPGEGQRGELANLVVFLVSQSAGLLERLAGIDRVAARSRGASRRRCRPDPALMVCSLRSESTAVKIAFGIGLPSRSATRRMRPAG